MYKKERKGKQEKKKRKKEITVYQHLKLQGQMFYNNYIMRLRYRLVESGEDANKSPHR